MVDTILQISVLGCLVQVASIDLQSFEVPSATVLLLAISGVILTWRVAPDLLVLHLLAAFAWSALFAMVLRGHRHLRGTDGLGWGDVKLIFGIALWLGWSGTVWCVLAAALSGAAVQAVRLVRGHERANASVPGALPFAPFLCLGAAGVWVPGIAP